MSQRRQGFTVIEVILVLAIAGVIFAGAFIALPALWANQRDADRKSNVTKLVSGIKTYQTNNSRGALPTETNTSILSVANQLRNANPAVGSWQYLIKNYVDKNKDFVDPASGDYFVSVSECGDKNNKTSLSVGSKCENSMTMLAYNLADLNGELASHVNYSNVSDVMMIVLSATCNGNTAVRANNPRTVAVLQVLEQGHTTYCANT